MTINTIDQAVRKWPSILEKAHETKRSMTSLVELLKKYENDSNPDPRRTGGPITRLDLPTGFPKQQLESHMEISHHLAIYLVDTYEPYIKQGGLEIAQQNATRKAERRDHWRLWFQKLVRWCGGIIGAVLLYSTLVWLQESIDFIKLPVIDVLKAAVGGS